MKTIFGQVYEEIAHEISIHIEHSVSIKQEARDLS